MRSIAAMVLFSLVSCEQPKEDCTTCYVRSYTHFFGTVTYRVDRPRCSAPDLEYPTIAEARTEAVRLKCKVVGDPQ